MQRRKETEQPGVGAGRTLSKATVVSASEVLTWGWVTFAVGMCVIRCVAVSLASTHWMPVTPYLQ